METRALCIAFFYAIGTAVGGITGPLLFGTLIGNAAESGDITGIAPGYFIGAALMIIGGIVAAFLGVDAENKSLEDIAAAAHGRRRQVLTDGSDAVAADPGRRRRPGVRSGLLGSRVRPLGRGVRPQRRGGRVGPAEGGRVDRCGRAEPLGPFRVVQDRAERGRPTRPGRDRAPADRWRRRRRRGADRRRRWPPPDDRRPGPPGRPGRTTRCATAPRRRRRRSTSGTAPPGGSAAGTPPRRRSRGPRPRPGGTSPTPTPARWDCR